jgi:uncharacterized membrane protein YkvA (DUF1232 family)
VLGYVDDLVIVPLGIAVVVRMIPPEVMKEHRLTAEAADTRSGIVAAAVIVAIWLAIVVAIAALVVRAIAD